MNFSLIAFQGDNDCINYLKRVFKENAFPLDYSLVIPKNREQFKAAYEFAISKSEGVFIVGGLGYTENDFVKECLAEINNSNLVFDKTCQENLVKFINRANWKLPPVYAQERLLCYPDGYETYPMMYSLEAAARGHNLTNEIILLPDNVNECKYLFDSYLLNYFSNLSGGRVQPYYFKLFGLRKDEIEERIAELRRFKTFQLHIDTDATLDTTILLTFYQKASQNTIDTVFTTIYNKFEKEIYADQNINLEQLLVDLLTLRKKTVSVAESITGGLLTSSIVNIAGASKVLYEGIVAYTNQSKINRLFVKPQVISQYSEVSDETAYEMAVGLLSSGKCDYVLATTGIAGPTGGTMLHPIGQTYVAVGDTKTVHVHKHLFSGNRTEIREKTKNNALFYLIKLLKQTKN